MLHAADVRSCFILFVGRIKLRRNIYYILCSRNAFQRIFNDAKRMNLEKYAIKTFHSCDMHDPALSLENTTLYSIVTLRL